MKKKRTPEQIEAKRIYDAKRYKEINKQKYQDKVKDYWSVYILPKANYVGITRNIDSRMVKHRVDGRDTSDYRILHEIDNEEDARRQEDLYHRIGFEGGNGRRDITEVKGVYRVGVKCDDTMIYDYTETLEDAYQCRTERYNPHKDLWVPKFEIDRL